MHWSPRDSSSAGVGCPAKLPEFGIGCRCAHSSHVRNHQGLPRTLIPKSSTNASGYKDVKTITSCGWRCVPERASTCDTSPALLQSVGKFLGPSGTGLTLEKSHYPLSSCGRAVSQCSAGYYSLHPHLYSRPLGWCCSSPQAVASCSSCRPSWSEAHHDIDNLWFVRCTEWVTGQTEYHCRGHVAIR